MRRYRPLPAVVFAILVSALVGGLFGRNALATDDKIPEHYQAFSAALSAIETTTSTRSIPRTSSTAPCAGCSARSIRIRASSARRNTRRCASARKGATTASASRFRRSTATSRRCASSRDRRRTRRAFAAATSSRRSPARTPKGWTTEQAMRKLRGPKGTTVDIGIKRRGYDELIPSQSSRATRSPFRPCPAYFMIDDTTGYIRMQDFGENTDRDVKHALRRALVQGHEAAAVRHPRQSRAVRSIRRSRWRTSSCRRAR